MQMPRDKLTIHTMHIAYTPL